MLWLFAFAGMCLDVYICTCVVRVFFKMDDKR